MKMKVIGQKLGAIFIIPCVVYLIFLALRPGVFGQFSLVWTLFNQSIASILLAWGMGFEVTAGNIDLSVGAEMILGSLVGCMFAKTMGIAGIIIGALLVAVVVGGIKSLLCALINMKTLILSIAYTLILGSIGYLVVSGESVILESEITILGKFPYTLIILVLAGVGYYILDRYSIFGAHCRALGGGVKLATTAGIKKKIIDTKSIFICSLYTALSAIIYLSRGAGSAAQPGLASLSVVFSAMTGVFIGLILVRYINMTIGTVVGVITMNIITIGLIALDMPSSMKDTVNGGFLLLLMIISELMEKRRDEKLYRLASMVRISKETETAQS